MCWKKAKEFTKTSAFLLGAILCFGLTIVLTIIDKVPAATLMAALFIVMVLFNYLPQMESFKAGSENEGQVVRG
jgi:hypothetical protein